LAQVQPSAGRGRLVRAAHDRGQQVTGGVDLAGHEQSLALGEERLLVLAGFVALAEQRDRLVEVAAAKQHRAQVAAHHRHARRVVMLAAGQHLAGQRDGLVDVARLGGQFRGVEQGGQGYVRIR
jgi:hypothetical protein